jgi:bacteriocin-like protein
MSNSKGDREMTQDRELQDHELALVSGGVTVKQKVAEHG